MGRKVRGSDPASGDHPLSSLSGIAAAFASIEGRLFDRWRKSPAMLRWLARLAPGSDAPGVPRGDIEMFKSMPGAGALCLGWAIGEAEFVLVDERGHCHDLSGALWWDRPDLFDLFGAEYGALCADACFLVALPPGVEPGMRLRLLARSPQGLFCLSERKAEEGPCDPVAYARFAFDLPIEPEQMAERFSKLDGALIQRLIAAEGRRERADDMRIERVGRPCGEPLVSLVIPLYGRSDFIERQLAAFAADPFIKTGCEILYVIDDPALVDPVFAAREEWGARYGVPLTFIWGGRNRGFSGASNLGLRLARAGQVLFLNSDVFPTTAGWLAILSRRLDAHPDFALLGARLLFPDHSLQHDGMVFEFSTVYGVWLNQHPGKGGVPPPAEEGAVVPWPAATGACLLGHREELLAVGGFSEDYLIGDFEDSDLCLKMEARGRRIGVCPDIELEHLERQSFAPHGSVGFRARVMLFNAWQHQERWRPELERHAGLRPQAVA